MDFDFRKVEDKWREVWEKTGIYKVSEDPSRPKYYVLDMFPYPSGAGLHVGHPLGYVASDIFARYKRLKGFNVLHPMGFDAFGLPAEQYAIETGTPPEVTTEKAIKTYRSQLDKIGFSYDWSRQVKTCDPQYYKWTQWIFLQLFDSWYNREHNKAENIFTLESFFAGNGCINWPQHNKEAHAEFTDVEWNNFTVEDQERILMSYRLAYQSFTEVNWCEALGTVLANDEVKDGKSERGGHPVERRRMRQWSLRITEYADRLLSGLDTLDWSEAMKDMQRNWIGRSEGASVKFLTPGPSPKESGATADGAAEEQRVDRPARFMTGSSEMGAKNLEYAKHHRKEPTKAEDKLWQSIRNEKLGFKFRRQHLIDKYIVDFVCLQKGLVVEVDGDIHELTKEEDAIRTQVLNQKGFVVIRFSNEEVLMQTSAVLATIKQKVTELNERSDSPVSNELNSQGVAVSPLPTGDGSRSAVSPLSTGDGSRSAVSPLSTGDGSRSAVSPLSFGEGPGVRTIEVFTTRPDTIFGATFMVIAPEHELVASLTTDAQRQEIGDYIAYVKSRTDVERQQEKKVTGAFTGSYAVNPFTNEEIPIYIAEYVLAGYGTGAIMAVPADDERDRKFAEKFGLPIIEVIDKSAHPGAEIGDKVGTMINSGFLNGMQVKDAIKCIIDEIEDMEIGSRKVNYRLRDAGYSRQRYWGEPFPIVYKNDIPYPLEADELPVELPKVSSYKPTGDGRSPLANSTEWINHEGGTRETDTMPGYAGSSWYFLRYMDPQNEKAFAAKEKIDYWQSVDLYLGGSEHAVGHLLYARLWHKFLYDMAYVPTDEPFKKLVNQGMIQGVSSFVYRLIPYEGMPVFISYSIVKNLELPPLGYGDLSFNTVSQLLPLLEKELSQESYRGFASGISIDKLHVDVRFVENDILDVRKFKSWRSEYREAILISESEDRFTCGSALEKMSKSKYNVVNPDDVIEKYGADCFRMFEMFLGPLDQSKPWDDKGIDGVAKFIRRFWRLFYDENGNLRLTADAPAAAEYKALHKTLKKIAEDIERLQFNTCISQFMICLNELNDLRCNKREILEPLLIALAPFAPFLTEELWQALGNSGSIHQASYPKVEEKYLVESSFNYPISINGKTRAEISLALDLDEASIRAAVLSNETIQKWTNGAEPKKFIYVKGRIINVVV